MQNVVVHGLRALAHAEAWVGENSHNRAQVANKRARRTIAGSEPAQQVSGRRSSGLEEPLVVVRRKLVQLKISDCSGKGY